MASSWVVSPFVDALIITRFRKKFNKPFHSITASSSSADVFRTEIITILEQSLKECKSF